MKPIAQRGSKVLWAEADFGKPGIIKDRRTGEQMDTPASVHATLARGYWYPIDTPGGLSLHKRLSTAFGSKGKRQNQLVARLKRKRGYQAPVRGGTGKQARTRRAKFAKKGMGRSDKWWEVYHALRREGHDKTSAAKIASTQVKKNGTV